MAKKLQQYYILKIKTSRLKKANYNITSLTINEARRNGELVSVGDSQMLRSLRKIKNQTTNQEEIDKLFAERKKLINKKTNSEISDQLYQISIQIDKLLFVPEIIAVLVDDNRHYAYINKNAFFVNNKRYVRLLCSSGNARRNTAIFVHDEYYDSLIKLLNNGHKDIDIVESKYNAYFALVSSATLPVSNVYFCVIPDCEVKRVEKVEFIDEVGEEDTVEKVNMDLPFNLWDGQGIISPKQAKIWASDLGLDYVPSAFIIRNSFIKGMVCVIDFHKFSDEIGKHIIKDTWGNDVNVRDMDLILTTSQFKMWESYDSCNDYVKNCKENNMMWGVTRYTPEIDNKYVFSNYQFLQAMDVLDENIPKICSKTVEYFNNVLKNNITFTLLYLLGKVANREFDENILDDIHDNVTKALLLNNELLKDPYIQMNIIRSLNKKIKESYFGNLLFDGNYQMMIADPYAFMEYMLSLPVKGLLNDKEHYSHYWIHEGTKNVIACRAPLTWKSEVNVLNFVENHKTQEWYEHINSGIIYNVHGCDTMLHADSDVDGDIVCTIDQPELINSVSGGLPITYVKNKIPKKKPLEEDLYLSDMHGFNSKIGFITNCSTTLYAMLPLYEKDSEEYNEILKRLKICRKEQGNNIDKSKGLLVKDFPKYWTNWTKTPLGANEELINKIEFNNRIIIDKRPYFFRHLYTGYNKKWRKYNANCDNYAIANYGSTLVEILSDIGGLSCDQLDFVGNYHKYNPLLDSPCLMNKFCHYMENQIHLLKTNIKTKPDEKIISILKNPDIPIDKDKLKSLYDIYKKYKSEKRNFANIRDERGEEKYKTLEQYCKSLRLESIKISSNIMELANLAVTICYELHPSDNKSFAWQVFGEGVLKNIELNRQEIITIPFLCKDGDIIYLDSKYKNYEVDIAKELAESSWQ